MEAFQIASQLAIVGLLIWVLLKLRSVCRGKHKYIVSLKGKHVVITGGSSGIGFALAKQCLSQGASVTIIARNPQRLARASHLLASSLDPLSGSPHDRILIKVVDVCDAAAISAAIGESFKWKPIDILICNAGTAVYSLLEFMKVKDLELVIRTNLLGCVYAVQAAIPLMKTRSKHYPSSIVLMSSLGGLLFVGGINVYTPTKYAIKGLAEMLRFELMPHDIKVSLVCPGFTKTPLLENGKIPADFKFGSINLRDVPNFREDDKDVMEAFGRANEILFYDRVRAECADKVAAKTMEGVKRGDFLITMGLDGLLLQVMSRGCVPAESFSDALLEMLLLVPLRLLTHVWMLYAKRVIRRQQRQEDLLLDSQTVKTIHSTS